MKCYLSMFWFTIVISFSTSSFCYAQQKSSGKKTRVSNADSTHIIALGKVLFANTCQVCHGSPAFPKAPKLEALASVQPRSILNTLDNGKMRQQAKALSEKQREAIAQYISHKLLKETILPKDAYTI